MTQYNPPPPGYTPPPGYGPPPPPPGFPPGQYPPPGYPPGFVPPYVQGFGPKQPNGAAVASLICGFIGCLVITPFLAILFGWIGLRKARNPHVGGRGMSIAGIILGLVWLGFIGLTGAGLTTWYHHSGPQRQFVRQYLQDLREENVDAAVSQSAPTVMRSQVESWSEQVKGWGEAKDDWIIPAVQGNQCQVVGFVVTDNGQHQFKMTLVKRDGQWKVDSFQRP